MIRFILADLRRMWLGSLVIALIVALAVALGVAVTLQERALRLGSARAADKFDLVIGAAGSENQLVLSSVFLQPSPLPLVDGDVLAKLSSDPRVAWAAPIGFGDTFNNYPVVGTTTPLVNNVSSGFAEGSVFDREGEAVIGSAVALRIGSEIKPTHGTVETGGHTHTELAHRVVGRLQPTGTAWDRAILVPIQAVWHIHGLGVEDHDEHEHEHDHDHEDGTVADAGGDHVDDHAHEEGEDHDHAHGHEEEHDHEHGEGHAAHADALLNESWGEGVPGLPAILVKPKTFADAYKLRQEYRQEPTLAVFPGEVLTRLYATLGDAKLVLVAVAAGSQVLVAASLLLVTVMHISQRRRQIGALRAFGAPRGALFGIVWTELFGLVLAGIVTGFAVGYGAARLISNRLMAESGVNMPVGFEKGDITLAAVLLVVAAVLAAIPAVMAYRQSPASALRQI